MDLVSIFFGIRVNSAKQLNAIHAADAECDVNKPCDLYPFKPLEILTFSVEALDLI